MGRSARGEVAPLVAGAALAFAFAGCFASEEPGGGAGAGDGGVDGDGTGRGGSASGSTGPTGGPSCLFSAVKAEIAVTNVDKVDLLFVVDDSGSMREEQVALRAQFPQLIRILTTGDRDGDGVGDFPPAKDLHLGVVSTDMGLLGIQGIPGCEGLGDDGILNNVPGVDVAGCQAAYPRFLTYTAGINDPGQTATDFACLADLGTDGCSFEQPLEAGLKALWPEVDRDPATGEVIDSRIRFLGDANGFGQLGHGDTDNNGFLRNDPVQGISLIGIVFVSDEEDCSSADTSHFTPDIYLSPNDPLAMQDLNLRCFYNPQNLYSLDRYVNGFKALRPGNEHLVVFAAIVGAPPDLVAPDALAGVDFADAVQRDAFYESLLADQRMQEVPDPNRTVEEGGNLTPSCITATGRAYPPRRFVQVARRFGQNGIVQSICQDDFGPAMDAIVETLGQQLGAVCLPRRLVRNGDGLIAGCDVLWELPPPDLAPSNTPVTCDERSYLRTPDSGPTVDDRGGQLCQVAQLAVLGGSFVETDGEPDGWYYDDFSEDVQRECSTDTPQRIAFTPNAKPPTGVKVRLSCGGATVNVAPRSDAIQAIEQPSLGSGCDEVILNGQPRTGDEACGVLLNAPTDQWPDGVDRSMFCHPELNVCVLSCSVDVDCPADWICDERSETLAATAGGPRPNGSPICRNQCESADGVGTTVSAVGDACLPDSVPESGFDDREAYVQTASDDCGGGACLVYRLRGDPRDSCFEGPPCDPSDSACAGRPRCATPDEVRSRVYCSCRCAGPEGTGPFCECPDGFSCVDALDRGPEAVVGQYCVRNGTFTR